jgi:hypothetical protein
LADDISLDRGLAKCRACNSVTSLDEQLSTAGSAGEKPSPPKERKRPKVPLPPHIQVDDTGSSLRIVRRWFSPGIIFLAVFCLCWDSFLVFWYTMAVKPGAPFMLKVFPILHVVVGVALTYTALAGFLNRTVIEATSEFLSVRHGPVPWPGKRTLPVEALDQLYCQEDSSSTSDGVRYSYRVNALMKGAKKVPLVTRLADRDQALFIEQELERWLHIKDRPVGGEMRV